MQNLRAKQVIGYVCLPGVMPRVRELFGSGFGFLAHLMAVILNATRLLPNEHPYLRPENIGQYGVRSVFAQAGANLVFDRKHIDQIAIFFTLILGFILLILQFVFLILGLLIKPVMAGGGPGFIGMFATPQPQRDIAFVMLDKVFGVPGFFNSNYAPTAGPLPFHQALQSLFQFYSTALLLVAAIIFCYYVVVIVAETAQTGTPFGRRFNHLWAPIRLVVALGLLVPINYGLNSGQYIVLMAAKMGSGFATNGWVIFNQSLSNGLGVDDNSLYARPKVPDSWPLVKFMALASSCRQSYRKLGIHDIEAYAIKSPNDPLLLTYNDYAQALNYYNYGDIIIRFGKFDLKKYGEHSGGVFPFCGEITFPTLAKTNANHLLGPYNVQRGYYRETMLLWDEFITGFGDIMSYQFLTNKEENCPSIPWGAGDYFEASQCTTGIPNDAIGAMRNEEQGAGYEYFVRQARTDMINSGSLNAPPELLERGWGGAGIWYNRIAEINGAFFGAVSNLPSVNRLPYPMQLVLDENIKANQNVSFEELFTPNLSDGKAINIKGVDAEVLQVLYQSYLQMGSDDLFQTSELSKKQNIFRDTISLMLGLNGLFSMRENTDIHPLAQLVGLGKGIVDAAVRNLFAATAFGVGGGAFNVFPDLKGLAGFINFSSSVFMLLATIGLGVGFMLYYVLPFIPFMYFFFAVGTWLKTIFEAMVGAPLWALAHLRIDGHGLPGESAMSGYYMIFDIFLRPILTVFGLIGSLIIFSAMVKTLNEIFSLVTANLTGFDNNPCQVDAASGNCTLGAAIQHNNNTIADPANPIVQNWLKFKRDSIDEFFFTIIYTMIVYMMANSCFKLIDQIPSKILRWLGAGVQVFSDEANTDQAVESMKRYAGFSGARMAGQLSEGMVASGKKIGQGLGETWEKMNPGTKATGGQIDT